MIWKWLRWRRGVRFAWRQLDGAHARMRRAQRVYRDTCTVFGDMPGAWSDYGPCGKAQAEVMDAGREVREWRERLESVEAAR